MTVNAFDIVLLISQYSKTCCWQKYSVVRISFRRSEFFMDGYFTNQFHQIRQRFTIDVVFVSCHGKVLKFISTNFDFYCFTEMLKFDTPEVPSLSYRQRFQVYAHTTIICTLPNTEKRLTIYPDLNSDPGWRWIQTHASWAQTRFGCCMVPIQSSPPIFSSESLVLCDLSRRFHILPYLLILNSKQAAVKIHSQLCIMSQPFFELSSDCLAISCLTFSQSVMLPVYNWGLFKLNRAICRDSLDDSIRILVPYSIVESLICFLVTKHSFK